MKIRIQRDMYMKILIDFSEPIIGKEQILDIRPVDLDDFYLAASDYDKNNLFFVLLTSILHYEDGGDIVEAAHLNFLAAYYLYSTLTPPGSQSLALHYINRAISLNHLTEYDEWLDLIKKGN